EAHAESIAKTSTDSYKSAAVRFWRFCRYRLRVKRPYPATADRFNMWVMSLNIASGTAAQYRSALVHQHELKGLSTDGLDDPRVTKCIAGLRRLNDPLHKQPPKLAVTTAVMDKVNDVTMRDADEQRLML